MGVVQPHNGNPKPRLVGGLPVVLSSRAQEQSILSWNPSVQAEADRQRAAVPRALKRYGTQFLDDFSSRKIPKIDYDPWIYALRAACAGSLALYISFSLNLAGSHWALTTCYIVGSERQSGRILAKSAARIVGTLVGVNASFTLVNGFGQERVLFICCFAAWLSICAYFSRLSAACPSLESDYSGRNRALRKLTANVLSIENLRHGFAFEEIGAGFSRTNLRRFLLECLEVASCVSNLDIQLVAIRCLMDSGGLPRLNRALCRVREVVLASFSSSSDKKSSTDCVVHL
jgi:Fusaric acid resistance protein family